MWILSHPYTSPKASLSVCEYLRSTPVKARLAYAITRSYYSWTCVSTAPKSTGPASVTSKKEQVRDQLLDKCRSHDLRKKLLAVSGKFTLQKARDIARSMETAETQAQSIESDSRSGNVNYLERGHFDSPTRGGGRCYRCGLEGHFARDPECKARLATCMKCKKVGHFAKACKTKEENTEKGKKNVLWLKRF